MRGLTPLIILASFYQYDISCCYNMLFPKWKSIYYPIGIEYFLTIPLKRLQYYCLGGLSTRSSDPALFWKYIRQNRCMNNYQAAAFIEQKLPEAQFFEKSGRLSFDVYKTISCLTEFVRKRFQENDLLALKKSLGIAEAIYSKGD